MRKIDKKLNMQKANLLAESLHIVLKESLDGKFSTPKAIKNSLFKILKDGHVEGRYRDEHWEGIRKLTSVLAAHGLDYKLKDSKYEHHKDSNTKLPNSKRYVFCIYVKTSDGKKYAFYLNVTCSFVGRTGTMEDDIYELTYYFINHTNVTGQDDEY